MCYQPWSRIGKVNRVLFLSVHFTQISTQQMGEQVDLLWTITAQPG